MAKKKKFGLSDALNQGFTETLNLIEKNDGKFRNSLLPLSKIELDPKNPRKLHFDLNDAINGLKPNDPDVEIKKNEKESLLELAETIKSSGIINPIVVYKFGEKYRIAAGERRCLASILAGKDEIDARIFNERPKGYSLRLLQWIENTAREDLSLSERIDNITDVFDAYKNEYKETELSPKSLSEITGLSKSQASYYVTVIQAPNDVTKQIREGYIQSLDKAAALAKIKDPKQREIAVQACLEGANLSSLRNIARTSKNNLNQSGLVSKRKPGKQASRVNFGNTKNLNAAKAIISAILDSEKYQYLKEDIKFDKIISFDNATCIFKSILHIFEEQYIRYIK